MDGDLVFNIGSWVLPILLAVTLHEAAHAYAAWRLGDPTARSLGRVTLNPFAHVSWMGTVLVPAVLFLLKAPFLFGWAKPVPVNWANLKSPKIDMAWVAIAGPAMNIFLAGISALALRICLDMDVPTDSFTVVMLQKSVLLNTILAIFNMIPVPPLDGGRVLVGLLPMKLAIVVAKTERVGLVLLLAALLVLPLAAEQLGFHFNPFGDVIRPVVQTVMLAIYGMVGIG